MRNLWKRKNSLEIRSCEKIVNRLIHWSVGSFISLADQCKDKRKIIGQKIKEQPTKRQRELLKELFIGLVWLSGGYKRKELAGQPDR